MLKVTNLCHQYGSFQALQNVSFEIQKGEIVALLGPNGAGKTTTMQILTTWLTPTSGKILWNNNDIFDNTIQFRTKLGYLPENNPLYEEMLVYDYLMSMAAQRRVDRRKREESLKRIAKRCCIGDIMHFSINQLSKGLKQRVGLAQAIIHEPEFLILDEATTGLDPNQIIEIRELIKEIGREQTILLSTHVLQEVTAICDRILILNHGKLVANGTYHELCAHINAQNNYKIQLTDNPTEELLNYIKNIDSNFCYTKNSITCTLQKDIDVQDFFHHVISCNKVVEISKHQPSMEELFQSFTHNSI